MAQKLDNPIQPVIGLNFHSLAIENVDHDALWLAMLSEARLPRARAPWLLVTAIVNFDFEIDIFVSTNATATSSL